VVGPELTEDVPAAVVGADAAPSKEPEMSGKKDTSETPEKPEEAAEAKPAIPEVADPSAVAGDSPVQASVEWEDDEYDDDGDEEATQIVHSEAVMRAIAEARAAQGLDTGPSADDKRTDPGAPDRDEAYGGDDDDSEEHEPTILFGASSGQKPPEAVLDDATPAPTNPTAVPWTDPGGEYGGKSAPKKSTAPEKVVLPENGELPTPVQPRTIPRNQQIALLSVALMVLTALLYLVVRW
jgi:hypothetical protein